MQTIQTPIIPVIGDLIRRTPGTISLGQGIVHYPPPPSAISTLNQAFADPTNHQYKSVQGIAPLRQAIADKLHQENGITVDLDLVHPDHGTNAEGQSQSESYPCIVVTAGSNMGFVNAILAITSPGDEIILQTPYYFNHEMAIRMAGCTPVCVATTDNYHLDLEAIAQAITVRTRAIVTISPNNPTGTVYTAAELKAVNQLCGDRQVYHISDEAYEYFTYGEENGSLHSSPGAFPHSVNHTISLFSLSKAYGFASWRIGYMVIPAHLLAAVHKIQDTILICPPVVSQYAALGALQTGSAYCHQYHAGFVTIRQMMLEALATVGDRITIAPAAGAFYLFLQVHCPLDSFTLAQRLITNYQVAVIPGSTFGLDQGCYLRVAYGALSPDTASEGIERLVTGLKATHT